MSASASLKRDDRIGKDRCTAMDPKRERFGLIEALHVAVTK